MSSLFNRKPCGAALVLVLGFLVLISGLVLAFFSSVTNEFQSARAYSDGAGGKILSDTAVQMVMGTIRRATSGGTSVAWTSQPGMIRAYGGAGGTASSAPLAYFKLYSSDNMEVTATQVAGYDPGTDVDGQWDTKPALFTDLNSPLVDSGGKLRFPLIDPRAQTSPGNAVVDGFSYTNTMTLTGGGSTTINKTVTSGGDTQRLPMPVKWIYVLKDGTLTAPRAVDGSGNVASWTGAPAYKTPSATNPVVGRIAFWTDDESCKININTASEGTYWDTPRVATQEDYGSYTNTSQTGMAVFQPAQREYQRYPGHPATTSLSTVFGSFLPVTSPYPIAASSADASKLDPFYNIIPRIGLAAGAGSGGSRGGSVIPTGTMTVDADRLYTTVDELMFAAPSRAPNNSAVSADVLGKVRFFLTANSSAPETTLFNTPRISIWPEWVDPAKRTASDKLLAFCSTINGNPYYFTRNNPKSSTEDFSTRNAALYQYLQSLTQRNIPGFGGDFKTKLGADRDQVLTSIYDYIRCTNLSDSSAGATPYTPPFNASAVTTDASTANYVIGAGQVVPIKITSGGNTTRGFGRMHTVSGAALVFYATGANANNKVDKMQAVFLVQFACPMHGSAGMMPNMKLVMPVKGGEGLNLFQAKGKTSPAFKPLGFPQGGTDFIENADVSTWAGRSVGGVESPAMSITTTWSNKGATGKIIDQGFAPGSPGKAQKGIYPFVTGQDFIIDNPATDTTFLFKGGNLTLEIRTQDTNELVQTLSFAFPDGEFKIPSIPATNAFTSYNARLSNGAGLQSGSAPILALPQDTVIELETAGAKGNTNDINPDETAGDYRMMAALADVPAQKFRPHLNYSKAGVQFAHSLYMAYGGGFNGATLGTLVPVPKYSNDAWHKPHVPSRVGAAVQRADGGPGDWDTGWGDEPDGAYINKSDDGDLSGQGANLHLAYTLGYPTQIRPAGDTYFSPNRQVPSPLMFGSIPSGVQRVQPWQTLLFNPRPEDSKHPGKVSPRDHLIADLFWMPVVEPYAISQPFSTSGKINLNYHIAPFKNITRSTGLHAVMKSTRFLALALSDGPNYKLTVGSNGQLNFALGPRRFPINIPETLKAFEAKFASSDTTNNCFKSASQICEMNLVPHGTSYTSDDASMASFWSGNQLTGDNVREKPYVDIYPRLTTKSNAYTVHFRVQVLKKSRSSDPAGWDERKDKIMSESRGSSIIERYIDLASPSLPDFAQTNAPSLDNYYKFRVLSTKKF